MTALITDPHEIANVAGAAGIQFMLDRSAHFPIHYYVQVPSCVPSTPFEHAGCEMHAQDLAPFADHPRIKGLGEMMNAFGVVHCDADILKKLDLFRSKVLDGPSSHGTAGYAAALCRSRDPDRPRECDLCRRPDQAARGHVCSGARGQRQQKPGVHSRWGDSRRHQHLASGLLHR